MIELLFLLSICSLSIFLIYLREVNLLKTLGILYTGFLFSRY